MGQIGVVQIFIQLGDGLVGGHADQVNLGRHLERLVHFNLAGAGAFFAAAGHVAGRSGNRSLRDQLQVFDIYLELLDEPDITGPGVSKSGGGSGKIKMSKSASVGMELNLLGKTVDEAIAELDKYLDDAYLAHMPSVRIVHGKGTGALRAGIHKHLKRVRVVKEFV